MARWRVAGGDSRAPAGPAPIVPPEAIIALEPTVAPEPIVESVAATEARGEARVCLDGKHAFFIAASVPLEREGEVGVYRGHWTNLCVQLVHGPYDRKVLERHLASQLSPLKRARAALALRRGGRLPNAVARGVTVGPLRCASLSIPSPNAIAVLVPWPNRGVSALVEITGSWMVSDERLVALDASVDAFLRTFR